MGTLALQLLIGATVYILRFELEILFLYLNILSDQNVEIMKDY